MKTLIKLTVLGIAFSGLVACSSAKKEEDSVLADLAQAEDTIQSTDEVADVTESTDTLNTEGSFDSEDNNTSLGSGSSGLGH